MIRQLGLAAAALATVALVTHPVAEIAAQSSKPKEIVVVGSKIKTNQKEKAAGQAKRKTLGNTKWGDIELKR
jgi:hypothetical protein